MRLKSRFDFLNHRLKALTVAAPANAKPHNERGYIYGNKNMKKVHIKFFSNMYSTIFAL